jgi:DNA-binding response OmpR family regulator
MTKILYAEDELFLAGVLSQFLTKAGFDLRIAKDGEEALKQAAEKPDLILLDLILPKVDGFGVLTALKADPELSKIPVIILSNLGSDEDREKASALGAEAYFVKASLSPQEVVDRVRNIVDAH